MNIVQQIEKFLPLKINLTLLIYLIFAFILATIIGTLSHEAGHYLAAKSVGMDAQIHYAYTHWEYPAGRVKEITDTERTLFALGGPLQTMLTGIIGLILLHYSRKKIKSQGKLKLKYWLYVFLALFWLRQVANLAVWIMVYLLWGSVSICGDEIRLAYYFNFPAWSILVPTAIIGFLVTVFVIFKYIPVLQRCTFIFAGLIGGLWGYYLWLMLLGPMIIP